jgi:hypothetical protein
MYGVYICNSETLGLLQDLKLPVETIDFSKDVSSGAVTTQELYLRVLARFSTQTCFVYIHGMTVLDDLFLKWCCEVRDKCIFCTNSNVVHTAISLEVYLF